MSVISDLSGGVAFSKMYSSTSFVVDFIFFQIENELVITSKLSNGAVLEVKLNNVRNMNTEELQHFDSQVQKGLKIRI